MYFHPKKIESERNNPWTTGTQSKNSEIFGWYRRKNMLRPYLKIWDWDLIFGCAVKGISSQASVVREIIHDLNHDIKFWYSYNSL